MSSPSFENIDQWFFEYTEGNLTPAQEYQLFEFLEVHPELMSEFKAWHGAKLTPLTTQSPNTSSLIKSTPFFYRPLTLVSMAVVTLLLVFVGIRLIPEAPEYSINTIDTQIIRVGNNNDLTTISGKQTNRQFIKPEKVLLAQNTNQSQAKSITTEVMNTFVQGNQMVNANELKTGYTANSTQQFNPATNNISFKTNKTSNKQTAIAYPHSITKARELDQIKDYLNRKNNRRRELLAKSGRILSADEVSQKSLKSLWRRIKRMVNRPTALRNTQDPYYQIPMLTGFKANPAMVGKALGNRIQITSRMQWLGKTNEQFMNTVSWDGYVYALRGGLGVDINYDGYNFTNLRQYSVGLTYSPKFSITQNISFEPALRFKMGMIQIDQKSDIIGQEIEFKRSNITPLFVNQPKTTANQMWYKDFGLGFMVNTKWFYVGFNADNIGRHDNNYYSSNTLTSHRSAVHYSAIVGTEYESYTRDLSVDVYAYYQNYASLKEIWLGGNFRYKWFEVGAAVNNKIDLGASIGASFKRFAIHYNADYTQSRLLGDKFLSHQITMRILLKPSRYAAKYLNF